MSKGSIRVRDENGEIFALSLGICSLLKGIDKNFVPKIGDVIEWKGGIAVTGTINIYNACIFSNYT